MKLIIRVLVVLFILVAIIREIVGCGLDIYKKLKSDSATSPEITSSELYPSKNQKLFLYGGENNKEYLGCLTCDEYDTESIWNAYGTYGSKYQTNSIWNAYGTYGSKYNSYSPWNEHSSTPPSIIDENNSFHGYFTINKYTDNRATTDWILNTYDSYEEIIEDVSK